MTMLAVAAERLVQAGSYLDVFSIVDGGPGAQDKRLKHEYRKLASLLHPDRYPADTDKAVAQGAFVHLQRFYDEALAAIKAGCFGKKPALVVKTKRYEHEVTDLLRRGDICNFYAATSKNGSGAVATLFKVARQPADNDLVDAEAISLRRLTGPDTDAEFVPFLPKLVESLTQRDSSARHRRANVLERADGWYSLEQVINAYPAGVSPLDMAWMWRRLLWVLGYVHEKEIVHGAVLPPHVLIHPEQHGLVLDEWCYSVVGTPIKAVVRDYRDWYPEEVLTRQNPSPGTDICLSAKTMIHLLGGDALSQTFSDRTPKALRAYLRGCCLPGQKERPQDAWQLLAEFDELLERLGPPFWPRRFHPFSIPDN